MIPANARERFLEKLRDALAEERFVKLTLSEPLSGELHLRNVYARLVELREGRRVQFVWRYSQRDVTRNVPLREAEAEVDELLDGGFEHAYLFTTTGDWHWRGPGDGRLKAKRPTFAAQGALDHDKPKAKALAAAPWLVALGVTAADGTARAGMADKLRQIERFAEILGHLVEGGALREAKSVRLADLGAGKGYLTFAAHDFFQRRGVEVKTTGIEVRAELVEGANRAARESSMNGLEFVAGDIAGFEAGGALDVLVALHACNTATDDALHLGVRSGARLIVAAPCCHQELRPQIVAPTVLAPALRHGILLERHAEILTDAIRALVLEIHGYEARVFEFIAPEHTSKNVMIAAQRLANPPDPKPLRAQLRELLAFHGLRTQRLAELLGEVEGCKAAADK
ncbi:MAG: SAM-dependent methyltransferase [Chthoniobacteraceae bacterium]